MSKPGTEVLDEATSKDFLDTYSAVTTALRNHNRFRAEKIPFARGGEMIAWKLKVEEWRRNRG